jgi:hypothetical protein
MLPFPLNLLVWVLIILLCAGGALWLLRQYPPPAPLDKLAYVAIVAIAFIAVIWLLVTLAGGAPVPRRADLGFLIPV